MMILTMIITIMIPSLTIVSGSTIDCIFLHCANALLGNSVNNVDSNTWACWLQQLLISPHKYGDDFDDDDCILQLGLL